MKKILKFLVLFLIVFTVIGCTPETPEVKVTGVTISSENNVRTIKVNETLQLTAKVFPESVEQGVNWSTSNQAIVTVNSNGLVTALTVGNVEIIATSIKDENYKNSFALIIEAAAEVVIEPESITITAENNVTSCKVGEKINLSATVFPNEASQSVSWSTSDSTIATVTRGEVTALKEGTVVISANAKNNVNVTASITLTIEASDDPIVTRNWDEIEFSNHTAYIEAENDTPLKVKGVVTYVCPEKENTVTYLIQNGTEGYYVYAQNFLSFPVELGKVYEVGGVKKYYRGLNEIVNVEYFKEIDENITYTVNSLNDTDPSSLSTMEPFQASIVCGKANLTNVTVTADTEKAYSFYGTVNGKDTTFRVDPSYMSAEEFTKINKKLLTAIQGTDFEFTGFMSAFGYGTPSPQIMILKADDIVLAEMSVVELLAAASNSLNVTTSIPFSVNEITLPTSIEGFSEITISWSSSSELINVTTGVVSHGNENTTVTLTAKLASNGEEYEKTFEVLVFAEDNKEYEVVASLDLEDAGAANKYGCSETKSGYKEGIVQLGTPKCNWLLRNALIGGDANDKREGTFAIRAKAGKTAEDTARIEIQQDGEYNVVEFAAAMYGNNQAGIQIQIQYSTDSGANWTTHNETITIESGTLATYRIKLPEGAKRVAIVVVENTGKTVNIDNIKLMK